MSAMHSPLNSPVHSVYRAGKTSLNRRQTLTRLGLLFMVGPLGIAAQHLEWQQWIPLQRPAIGASLRLCPDTVPLTARQPTGTKASAR